MDFRRKSVSQYSFIEKYDLADVTGQPILTTFTRGETQLSSKIFRGSANTLFLNSIFKKSIFCSGNFRSNCRMNCVSSKGKLKQKGRDGDDDDDDDDEYLKNFNKRLNKSGHSKK